MRIGKHYRNYCFKRGGISGLYTHLQFTESFVKTCHMLSWEKGLHRTFDSSEWKRALTLTFETSRTLYRSYLTPFKLSRILPDTSPYCWRQCGDVGNLFHMLWNCRSLRSIWRGTFSLISQLTGILASSSPDLALLNLNIDKIPKQFHQLISQVLTAACLTITSQNEHSFSISEVIKRVHVSVQHSFFFHIYL